MTTKSHTLFTEASRYLVGGVNSPVRAFKHVGGEPLFIERANGAHIFDADGKKYVDYVGTWGPALLGHAREEVVNAICEAAKSGTSFGAPTERETRLAKLVCEIFPSIELVRFTSSGTEAVMGAIRAARGFTKRDNIIKFDGCYHGHADYLLVRAGSGAMTLGEPDSAGVPNDFAKHTLVANYNDLASVEKLFNAHKNEVACVIVEPVAGNMGCVLPRENFLEGLRELCDKHGALLVFDEVMTGFRVSLGGAQEAFDIKPDLTCLGKIIGGGLPVGAYGGRSDVMSCVAPLGPVYQAGTLSGNPLAMASGIATLEILKTADYSRLAKTTEFLAKETEAILRRKDIPATATCIGSMWSVFFTNGRIENLNNVMSADKKRFVEFFRHMLKNGVYLAPSPYESAFVSFAHDESDIKATLEAVSSFEL